jgi:hypothetical protein
MSNLEKLGLYIMNRIKERFIDGTSLKRDIVCHMTKMKHFDFDIYSSINIENQINLPSKEDIQETFKDFSCKKVISYVDYFHRIRKSGQCHIYSYPFLMKSYERITNYFPGGYYPYVRIVSLYDEQLFQHDLFRRISLSFPFMQKLTLTNYCPQKCNINQNFQIIQYYHLIELDFLRCHDDYVELFLIHTNTYLHNYISLITDIESLARITHNFTRDQTKINCGKVNEVFFSSRHKYSIECLQNYFPVAQVD